LTAKFKKGDYVIRLPEEDCPIHQDDDKWNYVLEQFDDVPLKTILKVTRIYKERFWATSPCEQLNGEIGNDWDYHTLDIKAFRKLSKAEAMSHML
jgi:hypothetical protein